ncbi:MAG: hypothetical protein II797_03550, partial [Clostridia bacterium]|nr:hypothetical protein [Clostridia bacterium]
MGLIRTEELEKNVRKIVFSIPKEEFEKAVNNVYRRQVKRISIPGFRPGHAPRSIIEKMYGSGVFYEDAVNDLIPKIYPDVEKESGLAVVGQPEFDIETIDENGCTLTAKVYIKPEVEIKDYKGISVKKEVAKVTDTEINADLSRTQERNARITEVSDRPAQKDDIANIDYKGTVDCAVFCPYNGRPYRDKLTLFWTAEDFEHSENAGFLPISGTKVLLRFAGKTEEVDLSDEQAGLYDPLRRFILAVLS